MDARQAGLRSRHSPAVQTAEQRIWTRVTVFRDFTNHIRRSFGVQLLHSSCIRLPGLSLNLDNVLNSMRCLKKDAPPEIVKGIRRIEERADGCFSSLALLNLHSNAAVWALLVGGIRMVEQEIAHRGDNTADLSMTLLNVSRFVPVAMKWTIKHGKRYSALATRRWTPGLAAKVQEALNVAYQYHAFETCLPMWHKDRYLAELLSPALVRFTAPGSSRNRQVSAYQKNFRPKEGSFKKERPEKVPQTPAVKALFAAVLQASRKTGMARFEYEDPWTLWLNCFPSIGPE
jgi:hypothetical protein